MPAKGFLSRMAFVQETVWGTPVARTKFVELVAETLGVTRKPKAKDSMRRGSPSNFFLGEKEVGGGIELELMYDGYLLLLKHLMGAVADSGAGPDFTHIFTLADAFPTGGLDIEIHRDLQAFLYEGCRVASGELSLEADGLLRLALDIMAEDETKVSQTTFTGPTERLAPFTQGVFTLAGSSTDVDSFNVKLDNHLTRRFKIGSELTKEPARDGLREITGEFTKDWESADIAALYDKWIAGTPIVAKLELTGAALGGSNYKVTVDIPRMVLEGNTPQISGPGLVKLTTPFKAYYDESGTQDALKITVINGEATT